MDCIEGHREGVGWFRLLDRDRFDVAGASGCVTILSGDEPSLPEGGDKVPRVRSSSFLPPAVVSQALCGRGLELPELTSGDTAAIGLDHDVGGPASDRDVMDRR